MKHTSILATILFGVLSCSQAATIALWTFESPNTPSPTTNLTISGVLPATGSGTLSGVHAGLTVFYPQAGNGSTYSLGADSWLPGDYWQVHVSTRGLDHIQLSWDQNTNPYGPTNFNLGFSTDGATFTTIAPFIPVSTIGWQLNTRDPNATVSFNLSSWTALNDAPDVYFRLSSNLNAPAIEQIDNVSVSGSLVVPEPAALTLLLCATGVAAVWRGRQRRLVN